MPKAATNAPPPPRAARRVDKYNWSAIAEACRNSPGTWFLVGDAIPRSHAGAIRQGKKVAFRPPSDWQVVTRGHGEHAELHICYTGPAQ